MDNFTSDPFADDMIDDGMASVITTDNLTTVHQAISYPPETSTIIGWSDEFPTTESPISVANVYSRHVPLFYTNASALFFLFDPRSYFYACYVIFGSLALMTNLIVLTILIRQDLLPKWPSVSSLALSNLASGVHAFVYGVFRLTLVSTGTLDVPMSSLLCMATFLPTCVVVAYTMPPAVQCLSAIERLVAVSAFNWYRVHWGPRKSWRVVQILLLVTIFAWVAPMWIRVLSCPTTVTRECSGVSIIGTSFLTIMIWFAIVADGLSAACSTAAAIIGRRRMNQLKSLSRAHAAQFTRQLRLSCSMVLVAAFDLLFVTLPSIIVALQLAHQVPDLAEISLYSICSCTHATASILVCVLMNRTLRRTAIRMLRRFAESACGFICWLGPHLSRQATVES